MSGGPRCITSNRWPLRYNSCGNIRSANMTSSPPKPRLRLPRFHALTEQLRQTEADLAYTSELMGAVVQYAKTRPVFDEYKAAKYSKRFLAQHEAELADYRAAKAALNDLLDGAKLPKMAQLKEKHRKLRRRKRPCTPSTGPPNRKCGRLWRSRPTLTICWA